MDNCVLKMILRITNLAGIKHVKLTTTSFTYSDTRSSAAVVRAAEVTATAEYIIFYATKKENPVLRALPTQIFFLAEFFFFSFFPKSCKISRFLTKI